MTEEVLHPEIKRIAEELGLSVVYLFGSAQVGITYLKKGRQPGQDPMGIDIAAYAPDRKPPEVRDPTLRLYAPPEEFPVREKFVDLFAPHVVSLFMVWELDGIRPENLSSYKTHIFRKIIGGQCIYAVDRQAKQQFESVLTRIPKQEPRSSLEATRQRIRIKEQLLELIGHYERFQQGGSSPDQSVPERNEALNLLEALFDTIRQVRQALDKESPGKEEQTRADREIFPALATAGIISPDLLEPLQFLGSLRERLLHEPAEVSPDELAALKKEYLGYVQQFVTEVHASLDHLRQKLPSRT